MLAGTALNFGWEKETPGQSQWVGRGGFRNSLIFASAFCCVICEVRPAARIGGLDARVNFVFLLSSFLLSSFSSFAVPRSAQDGELFSQHGNNAVAGAKRFLGSTVDRSRLMTCDIAGRPISRRLTIPRSRGARESVKPVGWSRPAWRK